MKALVSGGAGFTRSSLLRCPVRDDNEITVMVNLSTGHSENLNGLSARFVEADIRIPDAVREGAIKETLAYGNYIHNFVLRTLRGEPLSIFGDGGQARDFVNVKDVAPDNLGAASPGIRRVFNIGCGACFTINELIRRANAARGMAPATECRSSRPGDGHDIRPDISAEGRAFGFAPTVGLNAGWMEYIAWACTEVAHHVI